MHPEYEFFVEQAYSVFARAKGRLVPQFLYHCDSIPILGWHVRISKTRSVLQNYYSLKEKLKGKLGRM